MNNPRRIRLQRMNAALPRPCSEETDAILETQSFEEGAVTLAELNNNSSNMNKKIQRKKMMNKDESIEMGPKDIAPSADGLARWKSNRMPSLYFSDGKRLIDFVLVYEEKEGNGDRNDNKDEDEDTEPSPSHRAPQRHSEKRRVFEESLFGLGLELEYASACAINGQIKFVLIHAPFKVLMRQAELMLVRMPVHRNDVRKEINFTDGFINACLKRLKFLDFDMRVKKRIEPEMYFCQPFVAQHLDCFVGYENPETFFTRADRARMVHDLLIRARYDRGESISKLRFGIDKLIRNRTYAAAYPLHEELNKNAKKVDYEKCSDRQLLWEVWVKMGNVFKYQPLDLIKNYFGTKIGFYFAWLGYYTRCLWPISLLGVLFVFYGVYTVPRDVPSNDVCEGRIGQELVCPICDTCDFVPINATCLYSRITYVFDNWATVIFAAIMSIWITLFLEGWTRYHAELAYKWNVLGFEPEEEMMRPAFQFRRKKLSKLNLVTKQEEPYIPFMEKAFRLCGSTVTVLFFIFLIVALLFGIVVYRVIVLRVFYASTFLYNQNRMFAIWITTGTAALINLVFILIMNFFYSKLALKLTNWECPRTQSEFDNSYTFKVFLFQFVNFYSSLFYIAFIKGRFAGPPHPTPTNQADRTQLRFGSIRLEQCEAAGCMVELVIQLAVIMVGKQIFNGLFELAYPMISYWFRRWRFKLPETNKQKAERISKEKRRTIKIVGAQTKISLYEQDFSLNAVYQQFLFDEYLEMVIQLGFVTLFVAAFPLAPLFALINNILEIRLDAFKFIITTQRPVPEQARNIGIWTTIINMISNLAVLCNAFVIAFTSDFIPKLYYKITQDSLQGYADDTFSYFDSSNWNVTNTEYPNTTHCRYQDYRRPPCSLKHTPQVKQFWDSDFDVICGDNYEYQDRWWVLLTFRLVFVLVFELLVLSIKAIFAYLIPDMPTKIVIQLQRERFLMRQAILQRRDTPEEMLSTELEKTEQAGSPDRPELEGSWRGSRDIDDSQSTSFQFDATDEQKKNSTDANFDGMKRMYSKRKGQPRPASAFDLNSADDEAKMYSSDPALVKLRDKTVRRWPTPSLLVVPPSHSQTSQRQRPKTAEVFQNAKQMMDFARPKSQSGDVNKDID